MFIHGFFIKGKSHRTTGKAREKKECREEEEEGKLNRGKKVREEGKREEVHLIPLL